MRNKTFVRDWNVSIKFTMVYLIILLFQIVVTGVYLYVQASDSAIDQGRLVMEQNLAQTRASILEKEKIIENACTILTYNENVQDFFEYDYTNDAYQIEDYQFKFSPIVKIILTQNYTIDSIKLYMPGAIVTEKVSNFNSLSSQRDGEQYLLALKSKPSVFGWLKPHMESGGNTHEMEPVFSYSAKIMSRYSYKQIGEIEMNVREKVLFDMLRNPVISKIGKVFVVDGSNKIVSDNIPALYGKDLSAAGIGTEAAGKAGAGEINKIVRVKGVSCAVISLGLDAMNCRIIGVFPVSHFSGKTRQSVVRIISLMVVLSLFLGAIIYFATNALLGRVKKLVKAMKQVRDGHLDISVEVHANDEFGELASSFNMMTSRIHDLVESNYKIQIMEREAELKALESQINPHFLYNTLAAITWTARKNRSDDVVKITNALAKFYRLVLSKGKTVITVKDELDIVMLYLSIQKIRFEDTLKLVYDIDPAILNESIVKNVLQPLVENALVHGIETKRGSSTLIVKAMIQKERLKFQIIDDGLGIGRDTLAEIKAGTLDVDKTGGGGSGYAIKNILKRMKAYYGERYEFDLYSRPGFGTVITLIVDKNLDR